MSEIYNHTSHALPGGGKDFLNKLRVFLIAQGWTIETYLTSVEWLSDGDGTYSWQAGNDDFLQVVSNGYGSQVLRYRFQVSYDAAHLSHFKFYPSCIDPTNNGVVDDTISTQPRDQNNFTYVTGSTFMSIPASTFNTLHLFGNDKFILWVMVCTSTVTLSQCFGTMELFPEYRSTTELSYMSVQCNTTGTGGPYYWDGNPISDSRFYGPFTLRHTYNPHFIWYRGASRNYTTVKFNYWYQSNTIQNSWCNLIYARVVNAWTGKRVMFQPVMFGLLASGVWEPIGVHPCYALDAAGLTFAQTLQYGTEEFYTFQTPTVIVDKGYAIRTA